MLNNLSHALPLTNHPTHSLSPHAEEVHNGPTLALRQVSRTHMGAYLCIASNGVPPSVSKRITLDVECECGGGFCFTVGCCCFVGGE